MLNDLHAEGRPNIFSPEFSDELRDFIFAEFEKEDRDIIVVEEDGAIAGFAGVEYVHKRLPLSFPMVIKERNTME
ncbi:MAG: hypothetical protein CW338_05980 [Clostridiales bacterium]|nr:hypothetical protein [Clostridiales bacterium]